MIEKFLDVIFPKVCLECGKQGEQYICSSCLSKSKLNFKIVNIYNKDYKYLVYLEKYQDNIRHKILNFKFYDEAYIGEYFIKFLLKNKSLCEFLKKFDLIIPVPMYKSKKSRRGYNQTELLANSLSKTLNIECRKDILVKVKENKTQSRLHEKERIKNVKNVFSVESQNNIFGKNIILVDDISTTGATIGECAKLLKKVGADTICAFVIAKT